MSGSSTPPSRSNGPDHGRSLLSRLSLSPSKRGKQKSTPQAHQPTSSSFNSDVGAKASPQDESTSVPVRGMSSAAHRTAVIDQPPKSDSRDSLRLPNARARSSDVSRRGLRPQIGDFEMVAPDDPSQQTKDGRSGSNQAYSQTHHSSSPSRPRQPIYPALASPPRDRPPRAVSGVSAAPAASSSGHQGKIIAAESPHSQDRMTNLAGPSSPPRLNGTSTPRAGPSAYSDGRQTTMQIIASSSAPRDRPGTDEKPGYRYDKQGRPLMSARRSATSSSKTVIRLDTTSKSSFKSSLPSPTASPDTCRTGTSPVKSERGLTEASAYARAVSTHLARPDPRNDQDRAQSADMPSPVSDKAHHVRPLPRPPNLISEFSPSLGATAPDSRPSGEKLQRLSTPQRISDPSMTSSLERPSKLEQLENIDFNFQRSPTLPALVDPRQIEHYRPKRDHSDNGEVVSLKPRLAKSQAAAVSSPVSGRKGTRGANGVELKRPSGRLTLQHLLGHPTIQAALLSTISINAFLSLTGSTEIVRHQFTGESVGRWVLREWGVHIPSPFGGRWPNLTVWEGFLESLLHDPATYSTYPARWHNLLRHLSLSHSLVVLFLRNLSTSCFPNHSLLPFEDEGPSIASLPFSPSSTSLASMGQPRSRVGSVAGSDAGSLAPSSKPPRRERVIEIVMPEPLAAHPQEVIVSQEIHSRPVRRRGSISSLASAASFSFGRRRSNSNAVDNRPASKATGIAALAEPTASMAPGKGPPPPVSYPSAKRYGFKGPNDGLPRSRSSSMTPRTGSIFSMQSSASVSSYAPRKSQLFDVRPSHLAEGYSSPLPVPPPFTVRPRSSFGSADSHRRSDREQNSPVPSRRAAFPGQVAPRCEPAFDRPMPYIPGRVPVLRVFVPLSDTVRRWPSAEGAMAAVEELSKCGALKRMQLGDLIVNTAIRAPRTTEHVLVFVPFVKHLLVPLQYVHAPTGHLPSYVDAFAMPPSYYYPFLPAPQIIYLNLGPYRQQGLRSMRLASDRRDMTIASGSRISAKRYLYVAGVEITASDKTASEWQGMVSLEAEGTAEGKSDLEARFGSAHDRKAPLAPWEIIKEKSMGGTVWLRLVKEKVL